MPRPYQMGPPPVMWGAPFPVFYPPPPPPAHVPQGGQGRRRRDRDRERDRDKEGGGSPVFSTKQILTDRFTCLSVIEHL